MNKDVVINSQINCPVDKKSQQVIVKDLPLTEIGYTKLKDTETFSETTARNVFEEHLKKNKKKKSAPVHFLFDRMRFTKKGKHDYLSYREIRDFQRFVHHPNMFMLFVVEEKSNKKSYETYACNNALDVQVVRDILNAANNHPIRILKELSSFRRISLASDESSEYFIERIPSDHIEASYRRFNQYPQNLPESSALAIYREHPGVNGHTPSRTQSVIPIDPNYFDRRTNLRSHTDAEPLITENKPVYVYNDPPD
ncbi:hypothetical protein CSKR_202997 [Clonorchis sinensis]|uniref:Trematode PH-like domain-containing protein n=1 Tax=Clonorchis sinensis TaxID=79923 RepID=A0A8T1M6D8_CLOSI|nr:hypothetical protein CSKR_202997 [Clonorchis sinensis]